MVGSVAVELPMVIRLHEASDPTQRRIVAVIKQHTGAGVNVLVSNILCELM